MMTHATPCPVRPLIPPRSTEHGSITEIHRQLYRVRSLKHATQTVFGEGAGRTSIMFIGEQPGDQKDLQVVRLWVRRGKFSTRRLAKPGLLLRYLKVGRVIITGIAGDNCVLLYARRCLYAGV